MDRLLDNVIRGLALVTCVLALMQATGRLDFVGAISADDIHPIEGHGYSVDLRKQFSTPWQRFLYPGDSMDAPDRSLLRLFESDASLGPSHSQHVDINHIGGGRFSHWYDGFRFSSSDNTDPRVNGRIYRIVDRPDLIRLIFVPLALSLIVLAYRLWRPGRPIAELRLLRSAARNPAIWFVLTLGLSAYIVAIYLFQSPPVPLFQADSSSYWVSLHPNYRGAETRPIGYSIVLHAIYRLAGGFRYLPAVQSAAYCLAVLVLQAGVWRLTRNIMFATIIAAVLLLFHALLLYSLFVMTEELFTACLVLHIAAAAWALATRSRAALVIMAVTAVMIVSLRPAGTFVLVAVVLFCLFWRGNRIFALRWAALPLAIGLVVFMGLGLAVRGIALERLPGFYAFPYVAYLYDGSADIPVIAEQTIRATLQPYIKGHEEAERDGVLAVTQYEASHFNSIANSLPPILSKVLPGQDVSALEGRLAMQTIRRHPLQFLILVGRTFAGGFDYALVSWPINAGTIQDYYRQLSKSTDVMRRVIGDFGSFNVDAEKSRYGLVRDYPLPQLPLISGWLWWALIIWFWVTAATSLSAAVFGHPSNLGFFTAYASGLAIGGYLFIALTTVVIPRFTAPLDAFIIVTIASGLLAAERLIVDVVRRLLARFNFTMASKTA